MSEDTARETAVRQLKTLGLSTYAARTFVALTGLGEGTAQDVSQVADVPRTRVYDAADELRNEGLVDVKQTEPKRFWAVSTETTRQHFAQTYEYRLATLSEALDQIAVPSRSNEQRGVWTVMGRETVTERVVDFLSTAETEIVYTTDEALLTDEILAALATAADRGVSVRVAGTGGPTERRVRERVEGVKPFKSIWDWADTPAGRLLMVDRQKTLVSVLVDGDGDHPPESRDETAIWGTGETNSLVVVLRTLFTWQLDPD